MMRKILRNLYALSAAVLLMALAAVPQPISAKEIKVELDASLFGHLDQHDTDCQLVNCGPTAAANSFLYLQQRYPDIYNGANTLVQTRIGGGFDLAGVANSLGSAYMGGCAGANCGAIPSGTLIEDFIVGKINYFKDRAPGTTAVEAQMNFPWRSDQAATPDLKNPSPKPANVIDSTPPTLGWIADQLRKGQDVELFMANGANQHYITLTGITFDDVTNIGNMKIIDPWTGTEKTIGIQGLTSGFIDTDYAIDGAGFDYVAHAVAESPLPVPEPEMYVLMLAGFGVVGVIVRRRKDGSSTIGQAC